MQHHTILPKLMLLMLIVLCGCAHDHDHDDHAEVHPEEEMENELGQKIVHLNEAQFRHAGIDTGHIVQRNLSDVIHANGYTELDPQHQAEVSLPFSSTVLSISVIEGSIVRKGEILAQVRSLELSTRLQEKSKLSMQMALAKTTLASEQKELERQIVLADERISAQKQLEIQRAKVDNLRNQLLAFTDQLSILEQSLVGTYDNEDMTIAVRAPISGHITKVQAHLGETVAASKPFFFIVDNSEMHADLMIYEKDLHRVKQGQEVTFLVAGQSNQAFSGEIYNIGKSFAADTKSVAVHAEIHQNEAELIQGMFLNALITIGNETVSSLPETAIIRAEGKEFVFIYEGQEVHHEDDGEHLEHVFVRAEVKTGVNQLRFVEVHALQPIGADDIVVLDGAYYLQSHLQKVANGGGHSH
ncbi:MAG: efflux RND transporter periplasmic adaptor subunit [Saprospiraceae bacterium]|nr:efflux RND transporter periplasmic adaptor subunit [Saprospiraceae bacterium]